VADDLIATLNRGHEAFNRGDAAGMMELSTPDVEWVASGVFPGIEGVHEGEAVQEGVDALRSAWEEFDVSLAEVLHRSADLLVVVERLRGRGRGSGVEVEMAVFSAYWFEDGRIRRRLAFSEREALLEAAGLSD